MEVVTKKLRNSLGAVLMYVVMAITVVAAIGISITLVATNLYSRTANRSGDQQAYLLAKSIGQTFAAENQYLRNIVSYLSNHPAEKVTAKATVYFDPSTMTAASNVNTEYLPGLSVTDAYMSFYLSGTGDYLYGDITVNYNGASATATLVMTCDAPASFERNMKALFDNYDIYATQPNGMNFNMSAQGGDSVYPSVALYNDSKTSANYKLSSDINADLTMTGGFQLQSSTTAVRKITGNVAAYGNLQLYSYIEIPSTAGKYLTVNGKLTVGRTGMKCTSVVKRDVYCMNDVEVLTTSGDTNTLVTGGIYSEGNVTITNAVVGDIYAVAGTVTVVGGTVGKISTKGTVILENCRVTGTVYAGALKVTNSTIAGNVTVQGANVAGSSLMPQGNMEVDLTAAATSNQSIGASTSSKIYVSGNLRVANYSSTKSLTLNGTVEVAGGLQNPLTSAGYPYLTTINGNLIVRKGIKTEVTSNGVSDYYNLSYLIGLRVSGNGTSTGNVVLDWSVPVFTAAGKDTLGNVASHYFTGEGLAAEKATSIAGTLFVCTNGKGTDGLAGSFCLFKHSYLSSSGVFTIYAIGSSNMTTRWSYCDIYLNNATLNHIAVGSASAYMGVATFGDLMICGGTVNGSIYAHNICLTDVRLSTSDKQRIYARTSAGTVGGIYIGTREILGPNNPSYLIDSNGSTRVDTITTTVYGTVDATGDIVVGTGVHFMSSAYLNCRQNLFLGACDIDCQVVVGNSVSHNSSAIVARSTKMTGGSGHSFYVNGTLHVNQFGTVPAYTKTTNAYVTEFPDFNTSSLYPFLNVYVYSGNATGTRIANGTTVTYMGEGGSAAVVTSLTKPYTVVYDSSSNPTGAPSIPSTSTVDYILALETNISNIINKSFVGATDTQVLYFASSATISGDLVFPGYVLVREGANLSVTGNMRCRSVQTVSDATFAGVANPSKLTYLRDVAGATHTVSYLTVQGKFHCTAELADLSFYGCTFNGESELIVTTGTVTVNDCSSSKSFCAANASVRAENYSSFMHLKCNRLSAISTQIKGSLIVLGSGAALSDSNLQGYLTCRAGRVDIRSSKVNTTRIVAKQLVSDLDTTIKGEFYLLGDDASTLYYSSTSATTLYTENGDVTFLPGSNLPIAKLIYTGGGRFFKDGAIAPSAIEYVEGSDDYNDLHDSIADTPGAPAYEVDNDVTLVEFDEILSYDKIVLQYIAFSCPAYITDLQKVKYVEIASKAEMTVTENTIWNEQALPLEWVFPSSTTNVAKTVEGEIVDLKGNGDSADKMTVAYKALSLWDTALAFGETLLNGLLDAFDDARESLNWRDLIPPYGDTIIRLARIVINHIVNDIIPSMLSVSSVSSFAGIANNPDQYLRYFANKYNSNVKTARGSADILVASVSYLSTSSTAYAKLASNSIVKWFLDRLDQDSDLIKVLKNLGWGDWAYIYRPCGVFFFNSGFVPEEVFSCYKTKDHSSYYSPSDSKYRTRYTAAEKDSEGRWYWGGSNSASGAVADCTWTFFTCTDPANPYTSAAKDLHIVLPKHTYFSWIADKENCVRIIGNGRVFLYLQEDTNIKIVGNYWDNAMATKDAEVFGGLRYVGVLNGETYYSTSAGRPTGVAYMDQKTNKTITVGGKSVTITPQLQPRMFIIGTGPHITFTVEDFQLAAYLYMPNGNLYTSSDWSGAAKYNQLIISNTSKSSGVQSDVYGMYVVDKITTQGRADYSVKYYPTSVDLSDTTIYYNTTRVTGAREKNNGIAYYRLAEFWRYPQGIPTADLPWYYKGIAIN